MKHERRDKQAAKTTIVGGQPPGNARELPPIPAGLEEILGMAAAEPRFASVLLDDRDRAVAASGVELSPTEQTILGAVPRTTLRQMVERLALTEQDRRYFLARSAAVLLVLVGGATAAAGCQRKSIEPPPPAVTAGVRPDPPAPESQPARPRPSELEVETGARPDRPPEPAPPTGTGIRPDRPEHPLSTTGVRPDRPEPDPTAKGGARPDRPDAGAPKPKPRPRPRPTRGIRPDYPRTKGISPDRPRPKSAPLLSPFDDGDKGEE